MEHESLEFKICMDDAPDTEVLARVAHLDIAGAAYMAAVAKFPHRNVQLRHGARIIKRHDGEPKPEPPRDPNLQLLGFIEAVDEGGAIDAAVSLFGLSNSQRSRLAVNLRGKA